MPKRRRHSNLEGQLPESPIECVVLSQTSEEGKGDLPSQCSVITVASQRSTKGKGAGPAAAPLPKGPRAKQEEAILVVEDDDEGKEAPLSASAEVDQVATLSDVLSRRIYLDPTRPELGWIVRARLPDTAVVMSRAGFSALLASKPEKLGLIQMYGRVISTPRYQQAFLRDYSFTGMPHFAEKVLPSGVQEVFDWANSQRHRWAADEVDQGGLARKTAAGKGRPKSDPLDAGGKSESGVPAVESEGPTSALPLFNSSLINWYMDGTHYIGTHADDERQLVPLSPIFTASLGATRLFRIRQKEDGKVVKDLYVKNGDVLVMGGAMQKHFKHEIVKLSETKGKLLGPRISLTFRQFV